MSNTSSPVAHPALTSPRFLQLRVQTANKTGLNASGCITYAVLKDLDSTEVFFYLLANKGGGYFSREAVSFTDIERCLGGLNLGQAIPAKSFRDAFVGRSSNNAGFLVAALRHEGLLAAAHEATHQHVIGINWDSWKADALKQAGEVFQPPEIKAAVGVSMAPSSPPTEEPSTSASASPAHALQSSKRKKGSIQKVDPAGPQLAEVFDDHAD